MNILIAVEGTGEVFGLQTFAFYADLHLEFTFQTMGNISERNVLEGQSAVQPVAGFTCIGLQLFHASGVLVIQCLLIRK